MTPSIATFAVGLLLGTVLGMLGAVAFGRHDDAPQWWGLYV